MKSNPPASVERFLFAENKPKTIPGNTEYQNKIADHKIATVNLSKNISDWTDPVADRY